MECESVRDECEIQMQVSTISKVEIIMGPANTSTDPPLLPPTGAAKGNRHI